MRVQSFIEVHLPVIEKHLKNPKFGQQIKPSFSFWKKLSTIYPVWKMRDVSLVLYNCTLYCQSDVPLHDMTCISRSKVLKNNIAAGFLCLHGFSTTTPSLHGPHTDDGSPIDDGIYMGLARRIKFLWVQHSASLTWIQHSATKFTWVYCVELTWIFKYSWSNLETWSPIGITTEMHLRSIWDSSSTTWHHLATERVTRDPYVSKNSILRHQVYMNQV